MVSRTTERTALVYFVISNLITIKTQLFARKIQSTITVINVSELLMKYY